MDVGRVDEAWTSDGWVSLAPFRIPRRDHLCPLRDLGIQKVAVGFECAADIARVFENLANVDVEVLVAGLLHNLWVVVGSASRHRVEHGKATKVRKHTYR